MKKPVLLIIVGNFVMRLGTAAVSDSNTLTDLNGFHCVDAHDGLCKAAIQAGVPTGMRTQPDRHASGNHLESSSNSVAIFLSLLDFPNHLLGDLGQDAADDLIVANRLEVLPCWGKILRNAGFSYCCCVAKYFDTKVSQQNFGNGAKGYPGRGFTGAGSLENVSGIGVVVLEGPGQIRMSRPRPREPAFGCGIACNFAGSHDFFPIRPVPILDHHRDGATDGLSMPHSGEKTYPILFDLHTAAAAVTALAAL